MTIAQIGTLVRFLTNTNSTTFSDANLLRLASERHKQLLHVLTGLKEGYLETTNSQNLVAGTQAYAIPSSLRVKRAEVLYDSAGTWKKVTFLDINEIGTPTDSATLLNTFSTTTPYADVSADNLVLYPIPTTNVTNGLKIWYVAMPSDFSATSETPTIPAEHHRILADMVAIDVRQMKNEISTAQAKSDETTLLEMMKRNVSPRVTNQDSIMKPRRANYD